MPATSEIYDIPGNADLSESEKAARTEEIYLPFKATLERVIADRKTRGRQTVLVTIHSFTPVYHGARRSVEIGVLHDADSRLADAMLARVAGDTRYVIRRNEPYGPADGVTHTLKVHGLANGLMNVMIEVRNDLIEDEAGQEVVAGFLAGLIGESLAIPA